MRPDGPTLMGRSDWRNSPGPQWAGSRLVGPGRYCGAVRQLSVAWRPRPPGMPGGWRSNRGGFGWMTDALPSIFDHRETRATSRRWEPVGYREWTSSHGRPKGRGWDSRRCSTLGGEKREDVEFTRFRCDDGLSVPCRPDDRKVPGHHRFAYLATAGLNALSHMRQEGRERLAQEGLSRRTEGPNTGCCVGMRRTGTRGATVGRTIIENQAIRLTGGKRGNQLVVAIPSAPARKRIDSSLRRRCSVSS